jgi:hypothetical protein
MRSTGARVALAVGAIAALVILFIVLNSDDTDKSQSTTPTTTSPAGTTGEDRQATPEPVQVEPDVITVRNGQPVGGVKELSYEKGDRVRLVVRSDVADEVHVHGYDLSEDVSAGGSVRFSFPADIEGVFEIELEGRGEQIAELRVSPS